MRDTLSALKDFLEIPRKIAIITHQKADADALGSSLGWAAYLRKKGHSVTVVSPTDYPKFLNWMTGQPEVLQYTLPQHQKAAIDVLRDSDLVCCLDFSRLDRINELGSIVKTSPARKALIDHHLDPEDFADYHFWFPEAAATCELIYDIIARWNDLHLIDSDLGACLYAGIMTDTGGFRHDSTTAHIHEIVADLIRRGVKANLVHKLIYDTASIQRLRMLGYVLSQKLTILPEYHTGYITLSAEELVQFQAETGDTEGFVNWILSVEGIYFAVLIVDRTILRKMSFRSVGDFAASDFAAKHFNGGGHKNAAGGKSDEPLERVLEKFLSLLPAYKDQIAAAKPEGQPI